MLSTVANLNRELLAKDLPLSDIGFNNGEVTFALAGVPGDPKFRGKLSNDKQKIEGTFTQADAFFKWRFRPQTSAGRLVPLRQ
ncbi:MAG: hypothetical protein ABI977_31515 [Acidobacteriota bacterium]